MKDVFSPKAFNKEAQLELFKTQDDLAIVLRAHFLLEKMSIAKLTEVLPGFDGLYGDRSDLAVAIAYFRALGAPEHIWRPLKYLQKMRNSFSHGKSEQILDSDCKALRSHMRPYWDYQLDGKIIIQESGMYIESGPSNASEIPASILFKIMVSLIHLDVCCLGCRIQIQHDNFSNSHVFSWFNQIE
ncbi:hypothetical protein [Oceanicaulis sp. UBA6590]|uniref:hypothetical protein n=1 Tax=Oceanicaulis sp. UBA6590 TaxID=1947008 RepID=UPI0025F8DA09|nr:hypothetical protein [Oceanicaulis sp. UBA6590]|tara:strand:+ start:699 stop:1256 length:558 start_codon:yes stop_codon:yes gene_type:complete